MLAALTSVPSAATAVAPRAAGASAPVTPASPLLPRADPVSLSEAARRPEDDTTPDPEAAAEERALQDLRRTDRQVRAHEQAHLAAAGSLAAGGPSFETVQGPDGRSYAVGGEVPIRIPHGSTPEETERLARQAQRAALAPSDPSAEDRAVAARAATMARQAQAERQRDNTEADPEDPAPFLLPAVPPRVARAYQESRAGASLRELIRA